MAARTDWVDQGPSDPETAFNTVHAADFNALGAEVNSKAAAADLTSGLAGKQDADADLTALAALTAPATKLSGIAAGATVNDTDANLKNRANHTGTQTAATISDFSTAADARITAAAVEHTANKGAVNGYAPLDASQLVPAVNLPSYVDDVLEYATLAAMAGNGVTGKIFVALDTNKTYRWSGSAFVEISPSPGSTDSVTEGTSNLYYTQARADARVTAAVGVTVQAYDADLTAFAAKTAPSGAVVGTTDTQTISGKTLTAPVITGYTESVVPIGNTSTAKTIALTAGTVQTATLTGNCTFTMPTATPGQSFVLLLKTGAGSFTGTFTGVKWPTAGAPTITTAASKMDILTFISDGSVWLGSYVQGFTP